MTLITTTTRRLCMLLLVFSRMALPLSRLNQSRSERLFPSWRRPLRSPNMISVRARPSGRISPGLICVLRLTVAK